MKHFFTCLFLVFTVLSSAQQDIHWDGTYQLQRSDFQSPATQIGGTNLYSIHSSCGFDFSFYMSSMELAFTKNFNAKVSNSFKPESASLVAPDDAIAQKLIYFARFEFDLSELYARKFRKKIYEEKEAFSGGDFFRPAYETVRKEFSERDTNAGKETDLGRKTEKLKALHQEVLNEIATLADYCKTCKPPKKKK